MATRQLADESRRFGHEYRARAYSAHRFMCSTRPPEPISRTFFVIIKLMKMSKNRAGFSPIHILLVLVVIAGLVAAGWLVYKRNSDKKDGEASNDIQLSISNFNDCKSAGYPIQESYPERCVTPDGKSFTNSNIPEGFVGYRDEELGFAFAYPEEWGVYSSSITDVSTQNKEYTGLAYNGYFSNIMDWPVPNSVFQYSYIRGVSENYEVYAAYDDDAFTKGFMNPLPYPDVYAFHEYVGEDLLILCTDGPIKGEKGKHFYAILNLDNNKQVKAVRLHYFAEDGKDRLNCNDFQKVARTFIKI